LKPRAGFIALALVASLAAVAPAGAAAGKAKGAIIIEGLTLAGTQFGTPSMQPTTVATDPVSIPVTEGDTFTYSTITCDRSRRGRGTAKIRESAGIDRDGDGDGRALHRRSSDLR